MPAKIAKQVSEFALTLNRALVDRDRNAEVETLCLFLTLLSKEEDIAIYICQLGRTVKSLASFFNSMQPIQQYTVLLTTAIAYDTFFCAPELLESERVEIADAFRLFNAADKFNKQHNLGRDEALQLSESLKTRVEEARKRVLRDKKNGEAHAAFRQEIEASLGKSRKKSELEKEAIEPEDKDLHAVKKAVSGFTMSGRAPKFNKKYAN
jgi:hypothetical protein